MDPVDLVGRADLGDRYRLLRHPEGVYREEYLRRHHCRIQEDRTMADQRHDQWCALSEADHLQGPNATPQQWQAIGKTLRRQHHRWQ